MTGTIGKTKTTGDRLVNFILKNKALFLMLIFGIFSQIVTKGMFMAFGNLMSISRQIAVSTIISVGFTVILASGQMDLSIGSMMSMIGICYGYISHTVPFPLAVVLTLLIGAAAGFTNGFLIRFFKLPAFVLTLAMSQVFKGLAYLFCDGKSVGGLSSTVKFVGQGLLWKAIPIPAIVMIVVVIIFAVIINRTAFGRSLIATGGNAEAASVSGINVTRIKIMAFVLSGVCVAVGSIVLTGRVATALPNAGDGSEMDAIAAVVIGGTSIHGGRANVVGTLFGVVLIGVIGNTLNLLNVSPFWQWVSKGLIIIIAIMLDSFTESFFNKMRKNAV